MRGGGREEELDEEEIQGEGNVRPKEGRGQGATGTTCMEKELERLQCSDGGRGKMLGQVWPRLRTREILRWRARLNVFKSLFSL